MKGDPFSKAVEYVYRLLAIRERSEKEIRLKLKEKRCEGGRADGVIDYFKTRNLIDDKRFVRAWIEDRLRFRPKGALAIKRELLKKGVGEDVIDAGLKNSDLGYKEQEMARALAEKRAESLKKLSNLKRKKNIYSYLARRGFSFDVINDIIDGL